MSEPANQGKHLAVNESPRYGPTLSTSTSSFEALEPYDSQLSRLATKAFDKTYAYISHDLNTSIDDYKLLEQMNRACIAKYSDMQQISENLAKSSMQLKENLDSLVWCMAIWPMDTIFQSHCVILFSLSLSLALFHLIRFHIWNKSTISKKLLTKWKPALINWMHIVNNWNGN